jgi:hypothetical protein
MSEELEALLDELGLDEFEIEQEIENYNQQNNN